MIKVVSEFNDTGPSTEQKIYVEGLENITSFEVINAAKAMVALDHCTDDKDEAELYKKYETEIYDAAATLVVRYIAGPGVTSIDNHELMKRIREGNYDPELIEVLMKAKVGKIIKALKDKGENPLSQLLKELGDKEDEDENEDENDDKNDSQFSNFKGDEL